MLVGTEGPVVVTQITPFVADDVVLVDVEVVVTDLLVIAVLVTVLEVLLSSQLKVMLHPPVLSVHLELLRRCEPGP